MSLTAPDKPFKENLKGLLSAIDSTQPEDVASKMVQALDTRLLPSFPKYVNSVWEMEVGMVTANRNRQFGRIDTEKFQDQVSRLDRNRKISHDAMISACSQINRFCSMSDTVPFCPDLEGDADGDEWLHRKNCADFCGDVVLEVFEGRDGRELSAERIAKIESRKLNHGTPDFDEAAEKAGEHKGFDPVQMKIDKIVAQYGDDAEESTVHDGPEFE